MENVDIISGSKEETVGVGVEGGGGDVLLTKTKLHLTNS